MAGLSVICGFKHVLLVQEFNMLNGWKTAKQLHTDRVVDGSPNGCQTGLERYPIRIPSYLLEGYACTCIVTCKHLQRYTDIHMLTQNVVCDSWLSCLVASLARVDASCLVRWV